MLPLLMFDFDGTLVDSEYGIVASFQHVLQLYSLRRTDEEIRRLIGLNLESIIDELLHTSAEKRLALDIAKEYADFHQHMIREHSQVYPGVFETLEKLTQYPKAIVTNRKQYSVKSLADYFQLSPYFSIMQGYDPETGIASKPNPDMLLDVLRKMDYIAENAFYIGDTDKDIHAAKAAGVRSIAVTFGIVPKEELLTFEPDYIVDHFSDIAGIVEKEA